MPAFTPHDYQIRAKEFCLAKKNVFLAVDMGLGKTAITLDTIYDLGRPAIVWGPLGAIFNTWPDEIKKWKFPFTYDIIHGPEKFHLLSKSTADILLINYHGLQWFFNQIRNGKVPWKQKRVQVLDESSMVKSPSTKRFKTFKKMFPLWDEYKFCLSATPSPNGYHELWSQYYLLDRGKSLFDTYYRYRGTYFNYSGPPLYKTTIRSGAHSEIEKRIKSITFRLDANDYLDMPEYIHNEIVLDLPRKLRSQYEQLENDFFLEFSGCSATAANAATLSMKLRQFLQGAVYTDAKDGSFYPLHTVKIDALKEMLETAAGQPILCPIQFKFERRMINEFMGKEVPCIAGGTSATLARSYIKSWNDGSIPLLLCHPASIGHGVNLQAGGHIVLWFGLTWSLEMYKQLNGRIFRQGQKNAVIVHHFLIRNTVDQRVMKVLKLKDATQQQLLNALRR